MAKQKSPDETEAGTPPPMPQIVPTNRMIASRQVKVRVAVHALSEAGRFYKQGDEFETDASRAASLGAHVQIIG